MRHDARGLATCNLEQDSILLSPNGLPVRGSQTVPCILALSALMLRLCLLAENIFCPSLGCATEWGEDSGEDTDAGHARAGARRVGRVAGGHPVVCIRQGGHRRRGRFNGLSDATPRWGDYCHRSIIKKK